MLMKYEVIQDIDGSEIRKYEDGHVEVHEITKKKKIAE